MSYPSPIFRITQEGRDLTNVLAPRLISLQLSEFGGDESDQLDLVLSDTDGKFALPRRGAEIDVAIGWTGGASKLVLKGLFTVDEVEHSGAPDSVTIRARTANLLDSFKQIQDMSFHQKTLGYIIDFIAFKNELDSGITDTLRDVVVVHLDQTRESDAAFLRRLGKKYDATATVKNNKLIFIPINEATTTKGRALSVIELARNNGDSHRYNSAERDAYTGVRVFWHDPKSALRRSVIAGAAGNSKRLRTTYASEDDARQAAVAEWQRIQRGLATFELTLARGNPLLIPKSPVKVSGFKSTIDEVEWQAIKVTHTISDAGFVSHIEMETKTEPAEAEREEQHDPDEGITGIIANWHEKGRNRKGQETAGSIDNPKTLEHEYASLQNAALAAKREWAKIVEVREIIAENLAD